MAGRVSVRRPAPLAIVIAAAILLPAAIVADPAWFVSDAAGGRYEELGADEAAAAEWAMLVESEGSVERSTLYRDGKPVRTWIREFEAAGTLRREAVEEGGILLQESLYDAEGQVERERFFLSGGVVRETEYRYVEGRLLSSVTSSGGTVERILSYLYAPDGRLLTVRTSGGPAASGPTATGATIPRATGSMSWTLGPYGTELKTYDGEGRPVARDLYRNGVLDRAELYAWNGAVLASTTVDEPVRTLRTVTEFTPEGWVSAETETVGGVTTRATVYYRDAEGRPARVDTDRAGVMEAVDYEYADGVLVLERRWVAGVVSTIVIHEGPKSRVEEQYDRGTLFARVYYEDGRKVREELLRDGVVVRQRTFP